MELQLANQNHPFPVAFWESAPQLHFSGDDGQYFLDQVLLLISLRNQFLRANATPTLWLSDREQEIIRCATWGLYPDERIEGVFVKYGSAFALIELIRVVQGDGPLVLSAVAALEPDIFQRLLDFIEQLPHHESSVRVVRNIQLGLDKAVPKVLPVLGTNDNRNPIFIKSTPTKTKAFTASSRNTTGDAAKSSKKRSRKGFPKPRSPQTHIKTLPTGADSSQNIPAEVLVRQPRVVENRLELEEELLNTLASYKSIQQMLLSQVPSANSCVAIAQDPPQLGCPGDHVFPALPNPVSLANILNQSPVRTPLAVASPEIPAVFERLDDPSRDLAALLVFLGRADIPTSMLLRAAKPKEHFNQAGEVELASALQLNPWFANSQSLNSVLELLESSSLIHICKESQSIRVMPALRSYVESTVGSDRGAIEYKASLLVFNSFPIHPNLETDRKELFATFAGSQVPHIQHVVGYFDTPDFVGRFSLQQRKLIIPVCLSSSGFGSLDWKCRVLDTAEKIIKTCEAHSLSSARLQLRRIVLRRLYYSEEPKEFPMHLGSNIFKGEMTLVRVQQRLYRDELFQSWQELESWQPVDSMRAGAEEELILQKKLLLQTRVCRFAGEFSTAKNFLCTLKTLGLCRGIAPYYFTEFVSVFCEAGDVEAAINTLPSTGNFWGEGWIAGTVGRRASHAAAGTHLMTGLWKLKSHGLDHALGPLREAKAIYQALSKVYLEVPNIGLNSSIRHFSISAGLAMIAHMEWRFTNTVTGQEALDFWQTAMKLGKASGKILGGSPFPEMIILYSMCDVASRLGLEDWTTHMMDEAGSLYQKTGRQFQYLALGTIWFDLVQEWNAENGLSGMSELCFEDYMAEQRARGFPYTSSARLCK